MFKHAMILCAAALAATPALTGMAQLSMPEEKAYQEVVFPQAQNKGGLLVPVIPPDWEQISLDGVWKLKVTGTPDKDLNPPDDAGLKDGYFKKEFNDSSWNNKLVPWSWYQADPGMAQSQDFVTGRIGWYRRSFELKPEQLAAGRRIVLDFRRAASEIEVWINGQKAGAREYARINSVQYDITPYVTAGNNTLAVRVYDYPGHKEYWRRNIGGLYEPVRLLVVPSDVYSCKMLVTPLFKQNAIAVKAEMINSSGKTADEKITVEISDWKGGKVVAAQELQPVKLNSGRSWVNLGEIKIDKPVYWSTDNPHLYMLTLKDGKGNAIGAERFGFREFKAEGEWLYLNGKKFKPRMYTFDSWVNQDLLYNKDGFMEKLIRLFKDLNVNMIRPHSGPGMRSETFFLLCDEIGMGVYVDWDGFQNGYLEGFEDQKIDNAQKAWQHIEKFLLSYYSHPSFCMLSFCNELYEGHTGRYYSKKLDYLYGKVKELDKQDRPVCSSTGRQTLEAMSSGILKERTDVLDDHQYRGAETSSWQDNIAHINSYAEVAARAYKTPKPKIDCEYGVPGDNIRYRWVTKQLWDAFMMDPATAEFKAKYIEFLRSPTAEIGYFLRGKMNYASPRQYLNEYECRDNFAYMHFKRPVEIYRRAGVKCIGGHTNAMWYDVIANGISNGGGDGTRNYYGLTGPMDAKKNLWVALPLKFELERLYNPTLVTAGVFNLHPLPGSRQEVEVFVTNDLNETAEFKVVPQLRLGGEVTTLPEMNFGRLGEMEQKSQMLRYTVPKSQDVKRGQLELFLFKNGKRVGDNSYAMTVISSEKIAAAEKIALYDSAGDVFKGLSGDSTGTVLKALGVKAELLKDFAQLRDYKYLIIGANSFDKKLIDAGEDIYKWVKDGGKLLCFEQSMCGKIPFFANYSITSGSSATLVSMSVPGHPAFAGLAQNDLDSWSGSKGLMYDYAISPLDIGLVAVAPTAAFMDNDSIKPVLCDVKVGSGEMVFSQISATKRINEDSVARKYLKNVMTYFLTPGVARYALTLPDTGFSKVTYVEDKDAFFVDLSKFVNQGFTDDIEGDGKGGWADFGTGFKEIPVGTSRLQGGVPFKIIDPARNNGSSCIVVKSKKRPNFPEKITGIPVNELLNSIFVLHTAMYAGKGAVLKYIVHYANGETREFTATNEQDIPDWWDPKDRLNATVVFRSGERGLYMSEFINPLPKEKIVSMDIVSCNNSTPFIIGITGRKRFTSTVAGVGEK